MLEGKLVIATALQLEKVMISFRVNYRKLSGRTFILSGPRTYQPGPGTMYLLYPLLQAPAFRLFNKPATHVGSRESSTLQIIRQTQCLHVTNLLLWFAQVHSVQNNIWKSTLDGLVCIIELQTGTKF